MKITRVPTILAGLLAIGSSAADATTTTYCLTSGSFSACASATFSLSQDGRQLTVTVTNLGAGYDQANTNYSLTAVAFFHLPAGEIGPSLTLISNPVGWTEGYNYGIQQPIQGEEWLGGAYSYYDSRIDADGSGTFVFQVGGDGMSVDDLAHLQFAWRGQDWSSPDGLFGGESLKCFSGDGDVYSTGLEGEDTICSSTTTTTVTPEPVSIVLLGTGLAGLAGVGARRRKQQLTD